MKRILIAFIAAVVWARGNVAVGATGDGDDGGGRHPQPVLYDMDAGFDDTVALATLARQHKNGLIELRAVTITSNGGGFLHGMQHIILDRDPLYTTACRRLLRDSGVTPVVLPAWSPNLNAFAERFVRSAKSECLDRMVLLGESHLQSAVREFVGHYHEERPHQGLKNELIAPKMPMIGTGQVECRERLGGLLKFYYREAA